MDPYDFDNERFSDEEIVTNFRLGDGNDMIDGGGFSNYDDFDFGFGPYDNGNAANDRYSDEDDSYQDSDDDGDDDDEDGDERATREIGMDDVFQCGETGDSAFLLPGTDIRLLGIQEYWLVRNDMPLVAPFGTEYTSICGDNNSKITWTPQPPTAKKVEEYAATVAPPDLVKLSAKMQHLRGCKDPKPFFQLIFTGDLLDRIIKYSNKYARSVLDDGDGQNEFREFTEIELAAFIGAVLMIGEKNIQYEPLDYLFSVDMYNCVPLLLRAFGRDRFKDFYRYLRFDDTLNRPKKMDRLHKIVEVFQEVVRNCGSCFIPGRYVTVDEALVDFRGRVAFKMFNKSKPAKYGIEIQVLADARSYVLIDAFVYAGKESSSSDGNHGVSDEDADDGSDDEEGDGNRVVGKSASVLKLVSKIEHTGRVVVTDRGFTSINLALELRRRGLHCLGTIRRDARGMPAAFKRLNFHQYYMGTGKTKMACECSVYAAYGEEHPKDKEEEGRRGNGKSKTDKPKPKAVKGESRVVGTSTETASRPRLVLRRIGGGDFQIDRVAGTIDGVVNEAGGLEEPSTQPKRRGATGKKKMGDEAFAAFLFSEDITICKYVPKKEKEKTPVFILSTIHHAEIICSEEKGRPEIVRCYNLVKPGVDVLDQMVAEYTTRRTNFRWTMRVFYWLIDTAVVTAYKAFIMANQGTAEGKMTRRDFIRRLSWALMKPLVKRNEASNPIPARSRALLGIVAAIHKYRDLFPARRFSLEDSLPTDALLLKASTPAKTPSNSSIGGNSSSRSASQCSCRSSQTSTGARLGFRMFQTTPTSRRGGIQTRRVDDRVRDVCYAGSCKKKRSKSGYSCELCSRVVCLTHGRPTYDESGKKVTAVYCREDNDEAYCTSKDLTPRKRRNKRARMARSVEAMEEEDDGADCDGEDGDGEDID